MGWSMLLRDPRPGQASALVSRDEDIWREEMENYQQVLYRTAVLANNVYFPPQIEAHNRISVMEKWYRAHAFQVSTTSPFFSLCEGLEFEHFLRPRRFYHFPIRT